MRTVATEVLFGALSRGNVLYVAKEQMEAPFMSDKQRIIRNLNAVENAVAQQKLEGLEVPQDVVEDMERAARGEIGIEEGIRNTLRKFAHGKV
jgi:hypothetical protein